MDRTRGVAEAAVMSVACAESRIMEVTVCLGVRRRVRRRATWEGRGKDWEVRVVEGEMN